MYALPQNTLLSKQISKKAIFEKFSLSSAQRQRLDADIARIDIVAQLSPQTLPTISKGREFEGIYVMDVSLKTKSYSKESILLLARLIPQRMLFALSYESEVQLAIVHEGFHSGSWTAQDEVQIPLKGLNFDSVWEYIVAYLGDFVLDQQRTLEMQIKTKKERDKILHELESLQKQIKKETQPTKKFKIHKKIIDLEVLLSNY